MSIRLIYDTFRKQQTKSIKKIWIIKDLVLFSFQLSFMRYFLEDIGFVISTFLFLMIGFQTMQKGRVWVSLLISAAFSYGVYTLYVNGLDGSLPGFPTWLGF